MKTQIKFNEKLMKKKVVAFKDEEQKEEVESCNCEETAKKITELENQLEVVKNAYADIESKMMKALADYANLERDMVKRNDIALGQLKVGVAREIITIIDDVNYAIKAKEALNINEEVQTWIDGLLATLNKLNKSLEVLGITSMECNVGEIFNSSLHEAVGVVYEGAPGTIAQVVQQGFVIGEERNVVRPARVIVCKEPIKN